MNVTCKDCAKPVHPAHWCDECEVQTYAHDDSFAMMSCLGSGAHVQAVAS